MNGVIFDIKRFAIHDGPGIRTTAFFQGCPLRCPWCHNPESIGPVRDCSTHGARDRARTIQADELIAQLERDRVFYEESGGGITLSGGEPLMQPEFLLRILKNAAGIGLKTAVDTSGQAPAETVQSILPFTDLFLYDLKLMDSLEHEKWTGVPNNRILRNLDLVCGSGKPVWIRIPLIAGITDTEQNMNQIADHIHHLSGVEQIHILPYHRGGEHKRRQHNTHRSGTELNAPETERLQEVHQQLEQTGIPVFTGG